LSSLYKKGKAQFVPEPAEVTKRQKVQAGAMASGFTQMLLLKIPAKQGIIAESENYKALTN